MVTGYNCICLLGYICEFQHEMTWSVGTTVPVFLTTLVSFNMKWHGHWVQLYLSSWLHWWVSTCNDMVSGYNCICLLDYTGEFQHVMTWSVGTTVSVFLTTLVSFNMKWHGHWVQLYLSSWLHWWVSTCNDMVSGYNCICLLDYTGEFQHVMTWSVGTTVSVFLTTLVSFNMWWHGQWVQLYLSSWLHLWVSTCNDMVNGYNCICLLDYTGEFQHVMTWSMGTTVPVFLTTLVSFNM